MVLVPLCLVTFGLFRGASGWYPTLGGSMFLSGLDPSHCILRLTVGFGLRGLGFTVYSLGVQTSYPMCPRPHFVHTLVLYA